MEISGWIVDILIYWSLSWSNEYDIELSLESEFDVLVKVSISLQSEFDPESEVSVILVKVSISLQSEFDAEGSARRQNPLNPAACRRLARPLPPNPPPIWL